jgi:tetratricopeptide (TPR) repeat protein
MRFDPQANYVPGSASGGLEGYEYGGAGSGFLRVMGRLLALAVVAGAAGAGWWLWSNNAAIGGPSSENAFDLAGPQLVPWRSDDRVMSAYQAGLSAVAAGQNHEAITHFKDAVVLDPEFAEGRYHLGLAYAQTGDHRAARAEHAALEELDPNLAMLLAEHLP